MGESYSKWSNWQGINLQNIKEAHAAHSRKINDPIKKWAEELNRQFSKEDIQMANKHMKRCSTSLIIASVQFRYSVVSDSLWTHELQHARPPCPLPTPRVYPNSCPLSPWCHPTISSSVVPFSSCPESFPASGSFQMNQLFTSDKCKSKPQWGTISHQSEWLSSKSLQAVNAGEGVEKREPSYTVGGNAN